MNCQPEAKKILLWRFPLSIHYLAQSLVDPRLVAASILLEPREDVGIKAQRDGLFQRSIKLHRVLKRSFSPRARGCHQRQGLGWLLRTGGFHLGPTRPTFLGSLAKLLSRSHFFHFVRTFV